MFMEKEELYKELVSMLPVQRNNKSFKDFINDLFCTYENKVRKYEGFISFPGDLEDVITVSRYIKNIVNLAYEGRNSSAFQKLYELLDDEGENRYVHSLKRHITNDGRENIYFYRLRKFENRRNVPYKEMFHIPFNQREKVTTQRYSIPGYPCLYLGKTTYGCWEELGRPPLDSFMISKFKTEEHLLLLDLTIPIENVLRHPNTFLSMLLRFPFILACMIQVKDEKTTFKPEYLFPQLMMEYIIEKYHKSANKSSLSNFKGIYYTSVYKNGEFGYPDSVFNNYAIPTLETADGTNYCPMLCGFFQLTDPTCEEYERIRISGVSNLYWNDNRTDYEKSSFGLVEYALEDEKRFPMHEMTPE